MSLVVATRLRSYEIQSAIGAGDIGDVSKARHLSFRQSPELGYWTSIRLSSVRFRLPRRVSACRRPCGRSSRRGQSAREPLLTSG